MEKTFSIPPDQYPRTMRPDRRFIMVLQILVPIMVLTYVYVSYLKDLIPEGVLREVVVPAIFFLTLAALIGYPTIRDYRRWMRQFGLIQPDARWILTENTIMYESKTLQLKRIINRFEVTQILEYPTFIRILTAKAASIIDVPRLIEDYDEIRQVLSEWATIQPPPPPPPAVSTSRKWLDVVLTMLAIMGTPLTFVANIFIGDVPATIALSLLTITGSTVMLIMMSKLGDSYGKKGQRTFTGSAIVYLVGTFTILIVTFVMK